MSAAATFKNPETSTPVQPQHSSNSPSPQSLADVAGSASRRVTIGTGAGDSEDQVLSVAESSVAAPPQASPSQPKQQHDEVSANTSRDQPVTSSCSPPPLQKNQSTSAAAATSAQQQDTAKDKDKDSSTTTTAPPTAGRSASTAQGGQTAPHEEHRSASHDHDDHSRDGGPVAPPTPNSIHQTLMHPFQLSGPPLGGTAFDMRRGSMNSAAGFMDDSFFRRPSLGFDMNAMDNFFSSNRRDSMDSSTAVLDAAIMDLSRRRFSTAMGVPDPPPATFASSTAGGSAGSVSSQHESISQRQRQLQQQQRELEQRQRDLEYQRQQLIASMQERSYGSVPAHQFPYHHRGSLGMGGGGGSLGLGSVHSQGSSSGMPPNMSSSSYQQQASPTTQPHRNSGASGGSSSNQSWWVCQICNSKAFVSHEEAMQHESICQGMVEGNMRSNNASNSNKNSNDMMNPLPMHDPHMMRSNPFITTSATMDGSHHHHHHHHHRALSLGLGTMDNSSRGVVSMGMDSSRGGSIGFDSSRNMSLGMDSSNNGQSVYHGENPMSMGPFAMLTQPVPLAMPSDKDWLTPLHCFVRQHCVEVFTASESDVATPSKGKRKPIQVGQIGIRCPHCHAVDSEGNSKARERGSVYYPTSISSIYNATMNLLQRHLHSCPAVPAEIMGRYETLKADDARSGTSKRYWMESARSLGLVDTPSGIRHSALRPPPLPTLTRQQESTNQTRRNSSEFFSSKSNADLSESQDGKDGFNKDDENSESEVNLRMPDDSSSPQQQQQQSSALVADDDSNYATAFSYHLLCQMQQCVFTEADRLGKRKGLPPGFPGLACRHCFGGYGSGRFFPSSIKTLSDTSKTLNVLYNHMMRCRKCPADIKSKLEGLRSSHDEERAKMKFGSQKAFFARIWERLHGKDAPGTLKRGIDPRSRMIHHHQQQQQHHQHPANAYSGHMHHHPMMHPHMHSSQMGPNGLDALAAVSTPSKRRKIEHSAV